MVQKRLRDMAAFYFDLDGCIYYGRTLAPGAIELLSLLRDEGKKVYFITNNSTEQSLTIAEKLFDMGLIVSSDSIITATERIGIFLRRRYGTTSVKVIGSDELQASLQQAGHTILPLESPGIASTLIVGRDVTFTYKKLEYMFREIDRGTPVIATNPDLFHPNLQGGKVPETGSLYAAIEAVYGEKIEVFGKPERYLFEEAMAQSGISKPGDCVMVGDNLWTDIAGGVSLGLKTVWVHGQSNASSAKTDSQPDWSVHSLLELLDLY